MLYRTLLATLASAALLAGCSAATTAMPGAGPVPAANSSGALEQARSGRFVYVADFDGHSFDGSIDAFALAGNGDVPPAGELAGSNTLISNPNQVATDGAGDAFTLVSGNRVAVFTAGQTGNVAPARLIADAVSGHQVIRLAADRAGYLYALYQVESEETQGIDIFAPGANGSVLPVANISGPDTLLAPPATIVELFVDAQDNIWWLCDGEVGIQQIVGYAAGASGDAKPLRDITNFAVNPSSFVVDKGDVYVTLQPNLVLYTPESGNLPAARYQPDCGNACAVSALDGRDPMFVSQPASKPAALVTYPHPKAPGKLVALRTIAGRKTTLTTPLQLAVSPH